MGIFLSLSILNASEDYSECITDIYFGNGVWNTYAQAKNGRRIIKRKLIVKGIIKQEEIMQDGQTPVGKKYAFKIAYNWHGMYRNDTTHDEQFKNFFDLAETFVQMKEAGQVGDSSLFKFLEWFVVDQGYPAEFKQQVQAYIDLATVTHLSNVLEMVADYQQYSFDKGHRVLLISHSQGNLWANDMVKAFKPWQREYFRNVGVAVPADHLEAESRYVTLSCDKVMGIIPGHMPANKECYGVEEISGHEFVKSYLRNNNSELEIFRDTEFYLKILGALDSQWQIIQEPNQCNSCDTYVVNIKHKYDSSIGSIENVLPYNITSFKLYQVQGKYVLASCGGKEIEDMKEDDESKICSRLKGTNEAIPKMDTLIDGVCIGVVDSDISYRFDKDTKELLVGSIGDNYWGGQCQHYKRYITLIVENSQKLKSFNVREVGFDDWIELGINGSPYYKSPYQLPANCELGTSFVEYPNTEIVNEIKEGLNRLDMHVIVTGGGEGWFRVHLK